MRNCPADTSPLLNLAWLPHLCRQVASGVNSSRSSQGPRGQERADLSHTHSLEPAGSLMGSQSNPMVKASLKVPQVKLFPTWLRRAALHCKGRQLSLQTLQLLLLLLLLLPALCSFLQASQDLAPVRVLPAPTLQALQPGYMGREGARARLLLPTPTLSERRS